MKSRLTKLIVLIAAILMFRSVIFPAVSWKTDEFCYLTIARQMNNGGVLYSDCADIKPVGIYYIYALADRIAGGSLEMDLLVLRVFSVVAVLLISLMLWHLGGYYAALLFAVYSTCIRASECLPANTEIFAVLFMAASLCFFCNKNFRFSYADLLPAAMLLSLSFLVSSRAGIVVLVYVVCLFLFMRNKVEAFVKMLASAAAFLLPVGILLAYYYSIGSLQDLINWQFYFIKYYVGAYSPLMRIFRGILVYRFMAGLLPLVFFGAYFYFADRKQLKSQNGLFLLILLVCLWLSAFSGGKHVERYYFPLLIPLTLMSGAGLGVFLDSHRGVEVKALILFMLLSSPMVYLHLNIISLYLNKYPKTYSAYMADKQAAIDYVKGHTQKNDPIFVWSYGDIFYCATERRMATPFFDPSGHLIAGKYLNTKESVDQFYELFFSHFEKNVPVMIIDETDFFGTEGSDINEYMVPYLEKLRSYVRTNYRKVDIPGKYNVYERKS